MSVEPLSPQLSPQLSPRLSPAVACDLDRRADHAENIVQGIWRRVCRVAFAAAGWVKGAARPVRSDVDSRWRPLGESFQVGLAGCVLQNFGRDGADLFVGDDAVLEGCGTAVR